MNDHRDTWQTELDRRTFLRRAGMGAAAVALPGILAACGSSSKETGTQTSSSSTSDIFTPASGTDIPRKSIKFGMAPYPDATLYVIGMAFGWFDEVGITIEPAPRGSQVTPDNVTTKLVTGDVDIATYYGPGRIATMAQAPNLKMFGFTDTYLGTYLLAAPNSGIKAVSELVKSGTPFDQAIKEAMAGVRGKRAALDNTGEHRDFINSILDLGGISLRDVKVTATTVQNTMALAKGGKIDVCDPNGAAQVFKLVEDGWYPVVSVADLLLGLPPGDPRAVAAIGHEGPACTDQFYRENHDTVLRFLGVMFRIIDNIKQNPDKVLPSQVPYISSVSGTKSSVVALKGAYTFIDPVSDFEEQTEFWVDLEGHRSYQTVYGAQIKAAQAGGVLPKDKTFTPDDAILGRETYLELVKLKRDYEELKASATGLSGDKAKLAQQAATHAEHRNYLDAYRLQKAASS